jgi:hypothetical protein
MAGLLNLCAVSPVLGAQTTQGKYQQTQEDCRAAAKSLRNRASEDASWQNLPDCGRAGGLELAKALREARAETDVVYLERLYGAAANIRDPDIFGAAMAVIQDEGASAQARSTAILILVEQHDNRVGLPLNVSLTEALRSGECRLVPFPLSSYRSATELPPGYLAQLGKALLDLSAAQGTPDLVAKFANCTRPIMSGAVADAIPTSAIRLSYVCGNRYRVENQSTESVKVSWAVWGKRTKAAIVVPPKGAKTFTTQQRGPTTLYYRGKEVQTETNGGKPCQ